VYPRDQTCAIVDWKLARHRRLLARSHADRELHGGPFARASEHFLSLDVRSRILHPTTKGLTLCSVTVTLTMTTSLTVTGFFGSMSMNKRLFSIICLPLFFALVPERGFAQQLPDAEMILLPVAIPISVRGAFGSEFVTELTIFNGSPQTVFVEGVEFPRCPVVGCAPPTLGAGNTLITRPGSFGTSNVGLLRIAPRTAADAVVAQLRVQDISRQATTWGTEIPVVRERDAVSGPLHLLDIPADGNFRTTLRIYNFTPASSAVRVRIFDVTSTGFSDPYASGELIREADVTLTQLSPSAGVSYAVLSIDGMVGTRIGRRLRVSVVPSATDMKLWAFVSVTHNESQHITTITPRK
jgi:hypothetical protein